MSEANGTYLWYYNICKREVWLMSRRIVPDQRNENIDLGRFIHEFSFKRDNKEISFGNVKFDVLFQSKGQLVIGETKKTSKYSEASKWQLMYYLRVLKKANIDAKGVLLYPQEKKRTNIELDEDAEKKLDDMESEIDKIIESEMPPDINKNKYCRNCGYKEYCYA